jgi:ATP-dependent Clp endopeptidase proteolytic subunit ClpP
MTKMQHPSLHWCSKKIAKKAKKAIALPVEAAHDDDEESGAPSILPMLLSKSQSASVYSHNNKVFFNDDITDASCFQLNKELRVVAERMKIISMLHSHDPMPIYLHLTTNGGQIYSAFSVIDCIQTLGVPVYTVVDGFVASAGTLISICGAKRFMLPNAYMLIHELRSEFWGKMTDIEEEIKNLKKTMDHVSGIYTKHTRISLTQLEKILKRDAIWNAEECKQKGLVDEIY